MLSAKKELFTPSGGGYQISRSVRLRSPSTAYFTRTPSVAGNQKTFTLSMWVKRGALTGDNTMFCVRAVGVSTPYWYVSFDNSTNVMSLNSSAGGALYTTQVFRDPSAWQHVMYAVDTTQATASNRTKLYINGSQVTTFGIQTYPALNADVGVNSTTQHWIGCGTNGAGTISQYYDGYVSEVNLIDGQALTPSSFGETNAVTGVWQPKKYAGTYGTNGFYLNFSDNSNNTAATIGKDNSGNGNNWTPNNISVTAGATYDSMVDSPTVSAISSNYAVMNPLDKHASLPAPTNGNLNLSNAGGAWFNIRSSIAVTSGKWYAEVTQTGSNSMAGVMSGSSALTFTAFTNATGIYGFFNNGAGTTGYPYANGTSGTVFTIASGDVIGLAYDYDAQTLAIYRNNSLQATVTSIPKTEPMFFCASFAQTTATQLWNFGQRPFAYTPPTGFKALNTQNLPDATIKNGATSFAATTYTGTGSALTVANTVGSASFQPDLVWVKGRSGATDHAWYDAVRGVQKQLESNTTTAETTETTGLTAFGSTGFTVGALAQMNTNTATYVAWQWNAGGSTVTNTSGSISAQVRANPTAGFSIVTYTGTGSAATIGHGLGVAPQMIIIFERSPGGDDHIVYHASLTSNQYSIRLNTTAAQAGVSGAYWNSTSPTSTVFSVGTSGESNQSTATYVAYCFAPVAGYSAFGKYTGNGSTDGPFVFTGFRPRFVLIKRSDSTGNWFIWDSSRNTYNAVNNQIYPDSSSAEAVQDGLDFLSNGFKIRFSSTFADRNANGGTYIYAAFAENPFKHSLAR